MFTFVFNSRDPAGSDSVLKRDGVRIKRALFLSLAFAALASLLAVGCNSTPKVKLPKVIGENPTFSEFIAVVNKNSAKIQSAHFSSANVGIAKQAGQASCTISYQEPNKFRLIGVSSFMGGRFLDCGSNGTTFWFWEKQENEKIVYVCDLDKFKGSEMADSLPLDPTWFPEALGIVTIKEEDLLEEPREQQDGTLRTKVKRVRPDGVYTEYIYFKPETAAIVRQDVQDPTGRTVVTVKCKSHQYIEELDVVMPQSLLINCAATNVELDINLNEPILNDPSKLLAFEIPSDNKRQVDLSNKSGSNAAPASNVSPPVSAEAQPKSVTTDPEPEPIPNGLQGPATVDASQLSKPLPEKQIYTAPVESGAGIVPFPTTTVVAAADPPQPAQNAPVQSYRVVPEIPQSRQDAVQPIATTSAFMNDQQVPQASAQQPLAPQENIAPNMPAQTPADDVYAPDFSAESATNEPLGAPSANYGVQQPAAPANAQYQQIQPTPQAPNRASQAPVYPGFSPEEAAAQADASQSWQTQSTLQIPTTQAPAFPAPSTQTSTIEIPTSQPPTFRSPQPQTSEIRPPTTQYTPSQYPPKTSWN